MTADHTAESARIGRLYVELLGNREFEKAAALWKAGEIDDIVGVGKLRAPEGVVSFFEGVVAAVPDMRHEVLSVTAQDDRCVVLWRIFGTFDGSGTLMGLAPNGRALSMLGTDVLTIRDGQIVSNTSLSNGLEVARQLAVMPPQGSIAEQVTFGLVNSLAPLAKAVRRKRAESARIPADALADKHVVITGAARGIGRCTAEAFVAAGARVAIGDLDGAAAEATAAEIATRTGGHVLGFAVDVTDTAAFAHFLDAAEDALGGLDVLVNNAGIMPTGAFLEESDLLTDRQIEVNVKAVITGAKLAGGRFARRRSGHIVNVASMAGLSPAPGVAVYCATKAAVVSLGDALNQEFTGTGVRVSTIAPSLVRTELSAGIPVPRMQERFLLVDPEEVAAAVVAQVVGRRGGLVTVPRATGAFVQSTRMLPEGLRNTLYRVTGVSSANFRTDETARKSYRDRIAAESAVAQ
ncbi:SDR family NAD(P)-dependent oxidoreductase [Nocardia concava]|uniref:SDR family NAD(P)-dependent oxidoreductase n=1 Tax=Nocardia concava TaxID=257281 RepID=UPI00030F6B14|nr:SDR family NAD(P)-dependent oxidoreductase [Nocardia concava]